ncbi:hypothetical protein J3F84DRAFT_369257 [Trichoderma pleuroticola]
MYALDWTRLLPCRRAVCIHAASINTAILGSYIQTTKWLGSSMTSLLNWQSWLLSQRRSAALPKGSTNGHVHTALRNDLQNLPDISLSGKNLQILPFRTDGTELGHVLCGKGNEGVFAVSRDHVDAWVQLCKQNGEFTHPKVEIRSRHGELPKNSFQCMDQVRVPCHYAQQRNAQVRFQPLICRPAHSPPTTSLRIRCLWHSR